MASILVTGGAGFIGSNFVEMKVQEGDRVVVLDLMTYAGHRENLESVWSKIEFVEGDIADSDLVLRLLKKHDISQVVNFAAESHVDRSISEPGSFVRSNVVGVYSLLQASHEHWSSLAPAQREDFRFLQVSTDEVFGELGEEGKFSETTPYAPNSPYSASKAGGDHLVRAWRHTYGLPTLITNCSNNYGPRQFPEKLIPFMITSALAEKPLPIYGSGQNVRDWIHVVDHCTGIALALEKGRPGATYCFGGNAERRNVDVVKGICQILDEKRPRSNGKSYEDLITFVTDRKGHDWRYAIDDNKAQRELGFRRRYESFEEGLSATINWYIEHTKWSASVRGEATVHH